MQRNVQMRLIGHKFLKTQHCNNFVGRKKLCKEIISAAHLACHSTKFYDVQTPLFHDWKGILVDDPTGAWGTKTGA